MTRIEWTQTAIQDVRSLREYIAKDSDAYADRFVQRIIEAAEQIAAYPQMGRRVPETDSDTIREVIFQRYRIMYRVEPSRVLILMVIHGARDVAQITPKQWEIF